ncbi:MAG: putative Zn-dependent protease [Candidatus Paceibacteria bacterium]|jgi:predicted Zn-dependent protease
MKNSFQKQMPLNQKCLRRDSLKRSSARLRRAGRSLAVYRAMPGGHNSLSILLLVWIVGLGSSSCSALKELRNFNNYSEADDAALGLQAFGEVRTSENVLNAGPEVDQVNRVTERLVASAMELKAGIASQFEWEAIVIDAPDTVNAFCLPGGKMAVYTGILPVAQGDAGLAVVMGHEIAHATERHGTERLTRQGLTVSAIEVLLEDETHQQIASGASQLFLGLPWGRSDELQADEVGLMILANAGYDPREAPLFWVRMSQLTGGGDDSMIGEFLSTHPSNQTRIDALKAAIPAAMPLYEAYLAGNPE